MNVELAIGEQALVRLRRIEIRTRIYTDCHGSKTIKLVASGQKKMGCSFFSAAD